MRKFQPIFLHTYFLNNLEKVIFLYQHDQKYGFIGNTQKSATRVSIEIRKTKEQNTQHFN